MLKNNKQIPVVLNVSYEEQLQLKLSVPQQFQMNKFCRHWLNVEGFNEYQQYQICKKYFSFLNQGDLVKIKSNTFRTKWMERTDRKSQNFDQIYNEMLNQTSNSAKKSITSLKNYFNHKKCLQSLQKIYLQDGKNQLEGLKIITLFFNIQSTHESVIKILQKIQQVNNSNILVNIFVNQPIIYFKSNFNIVTRWVDIYKNSSFENQIKNIFYKVSKLTVKRINLNLKCFNGQLFRNKLIDKSQTISDWSLQDNNLGIDINFPKSNKVYVHFIQFRNLGYQHTYSFQLQMTCEDINDKVFNAKKEFSLKPVRHQFQKIVTPNYLIENQIRIMQVMKIDQSLAFDTMNNFDKIQNIKIVCQKVQIQIKNNGNFKNTNPTQSNQFKMLHSFEI